MKKKGFTLVELLAVITLLGLLGLIVVPIVTNTIENQRIKTDLQLTKLFEKSAKVYTKHS